MSNSIYLINPKSAFPSYYNAEVFEASRLAPAVTVADLAITTVAAMVPDDFKLVSFITQLLIDTAMDDEILQMCAEAGLTNVFVDMEIPTMT